MKEQEQFTPTELEEIRIMKKQRIHKAILALILGIIFYGVLWYFYDWKLPLFINGMVWAHNIGSLK